MMAVIFAAVIALAFAGVRAHLRAPDTNDVTSASAFFVYASNQLSQEPLHGCCCQPSSWCDPCLAPDFQSLLIALGPALLVYAAHYLWVLHAEVSFEEASIAKAAKRAAKLAAYREGKFGVPAAKVRRAPFNLAAVHRPEFAFLWKNLLSSAEYLRLRTALITAAIIVVGCTCSAATPVPAMRPYDPASDSSP